MEKVLAGVIEISKFKESPERAVKSVLAHYKKFRELWFVSEQVTNESVLYENWSKDLNKLREFNIEIGFATTLKECQNKIKATLCLEIPPTCSFKDKEALNQLFVRVNSMKKQKYVQRRHAIQLKTEFDGKFSPWYMFVCLVFVLDWWRHVFSRFTFHTREHLRLKEISHGYAGGFEQPEYDPLISCCGLIKQSDRSPYISGENVTTGPISPNLTGFRYFIYTLERRDRFMGKGWLGWLIVSLVFYGLIAIPIWGVPLNNYIQWVLKSPLKSWPFVELTGSLATAFLTVNSTWRIVFCIMSWIFHGFLLNQVFTFTHPLYIIITSLIFPILLPLLFPFVFLITKLYRPHQKYTNSLDPIAEIN
jgi:hypothetical protein